MDPSAELAGGYQPLAQAVTRHLRDAILAGRLAPGEPVRQEAVARELGTSRIPVREALRQLESEGLVSIRPHSGARVARLDFDECVETYKIRERLEPLALAESMEGMTRAQLEECERLAGEVEAAAGDIARWLDGDRRFHLACYAGATLPRLLRTIEAMWASSQQYRRALLSTFTARDFALFESEHRLIVDALARRSRETGESLLRAHIERARSRLAENRELFDS